MASSSRGGGARGSPGRQRTIAELAALGEVDPAFDRALPIKAWLKSAEALYHE